jgi:DNA-binding PadR family transcriptional regulator
MATAELVLSLLRDGPAHGYDVKRGHDAWFPDAKPLAFGQVYATLARLERDGLAEVVDRGSGGGPERTVYAITAAGRKHLDAWLVEPVLPASGGADEIVRKLVAGLRTGADPGELLARQRVTHLRRIRELKQTAVGDSLAARLARDHLVAHLDADLRWLDDSADLIRKHKTGDHR